VLCRAANSAAFAQQASNCKDQPSQHQPSQHQPSQHQPSQHQASKDQPSKDQPSKLQAGFPRPSELTKDVFDVPDFDSLRPGAKLNFEKAQACLESQSDANLPAVQRLFDIFAWEAFIALNSPARAGGQPDRLRGRV
jgi:hypothetical protein